MDSPKRAVEIISQVLQASQILCTNNTLSSTILPDIVMAYARIGQYNQALDLANTISDNCTQASTLGEIAAISAQAGFFSQATDILALALSQANTLADNKQKLFVLVSTAVQYAQMGQTEQAVKVLSQSLQIADTILDKKQKAHTLATIALEHAQLGQTEQAKKIFSQSIQVANTIESTDYLESGSDFIKDVVLANIAISYSNAGFYEQALEIADTIQEDDFRVFIWQRVACKYAQRGQDEQALKIANSIEEITSRNTALRRVTEAYAEVGQYNKALELANTIEDKYESSQALSKLAIEYAKVGQIESATQALSQSLKLAEALKDDSQKDDAFREIAIAYARLGNSLQVQTIINQLKFNNNVSLFLSFLRQIASNYALAGQNDKANETFTRISKVANDLEDGFLDKDSAFTSIACDYVTNGNYEQALQIAESLATSSKLSVFGAIVRHVSTT